MSIPFYLVISGKFVIVGKEPDGDSVRFVAAQPDRYEELHRSDRIRLSRDGSVQLRFEGIDAPEVHYGSDAQILGDKARDRLLAQMGFKNIEFSGNRVKSSEPDSVPGVILSKAADANGRPVAYVLLAADAQNLNDEEEVKVNKNVLEKTLNVALLREGLAYYTVYTSTPLTHRRLLRQIALKASEKNLGVWTEDATSEFELMDRNSIAAPQGKLILPKLFRRGIDYLKAVEKGFDGNLKDWLLDNSRGSRNENDRILIRDAVEVRLSDLIAQRNSRVVFQEDLLNITFVEK